MIQVAHTKGVLKKRVERFLSSSLYGREEVNEVIGRLARYHRVAIFGGMLRDIAYGGNKWFSSDVDIVVDASERELAHMMSGYLYEKNKFGGYRVYRKKWLMDVWPLGKTWAFVQKGIENPVFDDLIGTTFFNWDAIVYDVNNRKVICGEKYFDDLKSHYLDINYIQNPNIMGAMTRALRYLVAYDAQLSPRLAIYVRENVQVYGKSTLVEYEVESYKKHVLNESMVDEIMEGIKESTKGLPCHGYRYKGRQISFDLL